jgi:hypothetical protein
MRTLTVKYQKASNTEIAIDGTLQDAIDLAHIRINDFKPSSIN